MDNEIFKWLSGVLVSVGLTGWIGYLLRDTLGRILTKTVEHNFNKRIETFKSDIRESENEIAQARAYISSARSGRDSIFQAKKIQAAESLILIRQFLYSFNVAVMYGKMLKIDELHKNIKDPKVKNFVNAILKPLDLDNRLNEYTKLDKDTPKLYLNDKVLTVFEIFEGITLVAATKLRILEVSVDEKSDFISSENVAKKIKELIPSSIEAFSKYGCDYIFHFHEYFYKEVLKELRNELIGEGNMRRDTESAVQMALDFRATKNKVKDSIDKHGLPKDLINADE